MLLAKGIWIVVADGEKALVLENRGTVGAPDLALVFRAEAPEVIEASDRPGRMADVGPGHRSAMEQPDFHRLTAETFAGDLVEALAARAGAGAMNKLVLAAPPQVLGALRDAMPESLAKVVVAEIDKTLTRHPVPKIAEIVAAEIDSL
jgi:protein required for attachment to host cells